jgi:hypothetical protein
MENAGQQRGSQLRDRFDALGFLVELQKLCRMEDRFAVVVNHWNSPSTHAALRLGTPTAFIRARGRTRPVRRGCRRICREKCRADRRGRLQRLPGARRHALMRKKPRPPRRGGNRFGDPARHSPDSSDGKSGWTMMDEPPWPSAWWGLDETLRRRQKTCGWAGSSGSERATNLPTKVSDFRSIFAPGSNQTGLTTRAIG